MRKILVLPHALLDELSASFLDRRSFKVRSAAGADEGIELAATWAPALIIYSADLELAPPEGFSHRLRRSPDFGATRLLLLSNREGCEAAELLAEADVDAHLLQPVEQTQLLNAVGALLDVEVRRSPRLRCELLAKVDVSASERRQTPPILANILGLSETGLLLECERQLRIGDVVVVQFVVPDRSLRVALRSMVLRADELQLHYGCEFLDFAPLDRDAIRDYVSRQLTRREKLGHRRRRE
jgi:DNA-binding NarL/FixJ family response regulator